MIEAIAKAIKSFELEVKGIGDAGQCQVQRGGFCSGSVNAKTMEASAVSGLYLCGEALDVDAPCGGITFIGRGQAVFWQGFRSRAT